MSSREDSYRTALSPAAGSRWTRIAPILTLLLLAPVISELLYGAVRVSTIFILIPEILTWGCGALLIRECVRAWRKDRQSMLLLGLALAVAEEWVMQQTSISPLVSAGQRGYGRVWGVNWVYFLWALGYESVWVVLIPVQLTELLFPDRRRWLGARGFLIASAAFVVGAFVAWYGWTHRARVAIFHMAPYSPPPAYILIGLVAILALVLAAYHLPSGKQLRDHAFRHSAPAPWMVGAVTCLLGAPWAAFAVLGWGEGALPGAPFQLVLIAGLAWACLALFLVRRWTSSSGWDDPHRFAQVFGGTLACMIGGFMFFTVDGARRIDWIGKGVFDTAAVAALIVAWVRRTRRSAT